MSKRQIQKWIIIPDLHVPYHDRRSLAAVERLMADYRFDGYINIGDFVDFDCISSHNLHNLRAVENKRIVADYKAAADILDRHQRIIRKKNKNARFVLIEGNHDERIERYINANPACEGMMEVPLALQLKARGVEWVPFWTKGDVFRVGKATFIHGRFCTDGEFQYQVLRINNHTFSYAGKIYRG